MEILLNSEQKARAFNAFWGAYGDAGGDAERARAATEYGIRPFNYTLLEESPHATLSSN